MALTISASPLGYLGGSVTITASSISTSPSRWGLFLFYKAVASEIPYYSNPVAGNYLNPATDTYWDVTLPMNAIYTFYSLAIKPYDSALTYGLADWTFGGDGSIYISKAGSNVGHSLDNQTWWRKFESYDNQSVPLKTSNVLASSLEVASLVQSVTNNTAFLGLNIKMRMSCDSSVQTIALNDQTGNFSFDTNPNGYGGVNAYRGDYAYALFLTNTRADGTVYTYTPRAYSYRSALKYNIDVPRDGLYRLDLFMAQLFVSGTSYNTNDLVFEETSNTFYKSLIDYNLDAISDTDSWVAISTLSEFQQAEYYQLCQFYFIQDNNGRKLLYDLGAGIKDSCPCGCASKCGDDLYKKYMFVMQCIENACFAKQLGKYELSQCFLEKIPKNCAPYISIYKC